VTSASTQGTTVLADDGCRLWTAETGHGTPADHVPRSAVDSLAGALPNLTRVVLPGAGHVPWLEVPAEFGGHVPGFLRAP
jgi:pimeloyl-ACP methyl ester carboxylesterase